MLWPELLTDGSGEDVLARGVILLFVSSNKLAKTNSRLPQDCNSLPAEIEGGGRERGSHSRFMFVLHVHGNVAFHGAAAYFATGRWRASCSLIGLVAPCLPASRW